MVYELLIFADLPAQLRGDLGAGLVAQAQKDPRAERLQSVRHASELPSTERSELMDCVATMGITRHCRVRANAFSSPLGSSSPTLANA